LHVVGKKSPTGTGTPDAVKKSEPDAAAAGGGPLTRGALPLGVFATQGKVEWHCSAAVALLTGALRTNFGCGQRGRGLVTSPTGTAVSPAGALAIGDLAFEPSPIFIARGLPRGLLHAGLLLAGMRFCSVAGGRGSAAGPGGSVYLGVPLHGAVCPFFGLLAAGCCGSGGGSSDGVLGVSCSTGRILNWASITMISDIADSTSSLSAPSIAVGRL
jgi:hypothetical protein